MNKDKKMEWGFIEKEWNDMVSMACRPAMKRLSKDFITDEEKSVKWNREQITKNHESYDQEVVRLNQEKNKKRDDILLKIYTYISIDTDTDMEIVKIIWEYTYRKEYSLSETKDKVCGLTGLVKKIIPLVNKKTP